MKNPGDTFYLLIMAVTAIGFFNFSFACRTIRERSWRAWRVGGRTVLLRWWAAGLFGAALSYGAEEIYSWYRLGYAEAPWADGLALAACGWLAANGLAFPFLLPLCILSFWKRARKFCVRLGRLVFFFAVVLGVWGTTLGWRGTEVVTVEVEIPDLPDAFEGFRVAQLSDAHLGPYYRTDELARDLRRAEEARADFLAITGDLIDDNRFMPEVTALLREEAPKFSAGAAFIWGNHEYYHTMRTVREGLAAAGVPLLENASLPLTREGATLYVAGVDYPWSRDRGEEIAAMTDAALAEIPRGAPVLLLAHHPDFIGEGLRRGVPLTLAGHTHGMQLGLFGRPLLSPYEYTRGRYGEAGRTGYVTRGAGGWFPFRMGCGKEITIYELRKVNSEK